MKTILLTLICLSVVLFAACGNTQNIINSAPDVSADNSESSDVVSEDASEDVSDEVSNEVSNDVSNDTSAPVEHT
ncbi:MAG: hypothetical protein IKU23_06550, partial [Clostridia bacterium]|nr:hypothetical protein [Clostridia bacterium]